MMTKILVYAYTQKVYSSRQIAKAVREQLPFMWIAAREELGESSQVTSDDLRETVKDLESRLEEEPKNKKLKKAVKTIKKDYLPRTEKYENYQSTFRDRNRFSKTDHDATFMLMKEDHMKTGQLKPGYNIQLGIENQFILGYSIHQKPSDTSCLVSHMERIKDLIGEVPKKVIADAGYGSEENYRYLEEKEKNAIVKFNTYFEEQKRSWRKKIFRLENMDYDGENDMFICPNGKKLTYQFEKQYTTDAGYITKRRIYRCFDCPDCNLK